MISINQNDLQDINNSLSKLDELAQRGALKQFASMVYNRSIENADEHTKTGALMQSVYLKKESDYFIIGTDARIAPYANFVHFGTKPHKIERKNRKALRWVSGGMFAFAKSVNHPGYKGDPFIINAINDEMPKFNVWMERQINDL